MSFAAWASAWVGDFDGNGLADVFLYDRATGAWTQALRTSAGAFDQFTSTWSPGWRLFVREFGADARADLLLYNPDTGVWFRASSGAPGAFTCETGSFAPNAGIVANVARVP